ncbi:retrovirus-related pol polyprotein from transposon TNT 1-94 [Tanacetum coccineum]
MIDNQKSLKDNHGLGFIEDIASTSKTKMEKLGLVDEETSTVEPAVPVPSAREPASSNNGNRPSAKESVILESNVLKRNSSVQITRKPSSNTPVRLKVKLEPDEWIKDSGCSRYITGNKYLFSTYKAIDGGNVVFGSNTKSKIIEKGQICDKRCKVLFSDTSSEILKDDITIGKGIRKNGLYIMKMGNTPKDSICLTSIDDASTLWHRRLGHANMRLIQSLSSKELIQVQKGCPIISIRTDHGREFDNEVQFGAFCDANGITHNFLAPRTPQSNGVVERKNRTLQEMSRTMLNEQSIPQKFWCNAVDTSTYILNRILIRPFLEKSPYELFKGKKPSLEYFKVFGSNRFILITKDYLTKFDPKSTEGVFLGYSPNSKAYIILNKETMRIEESLNVRFDETPPPKSSLL